MKKTKLIHGLFEHIQHNSIPLHFTIDILLFSLNVYLNMFHQNALKSCVYQYTEYIEEHRKFKVEWRKQHSETIDATFEFFSLNFTVLV